MSLWMNTNYNLAKNKMRRFAIALTIISLNLNLSYSQAIYEFKVNAKDTLMGVLNNNGDVIINNDYLSFEWINSYVLGKQADLSGSTLFNSSGRIIRKGINDFYDIGNHKHLLLKEYKPNNNGKWGLFSISGEQITNFIYDNRIFFSAELVNYALVIKDSSYALIDTLGTVLYSNQKKEFR